MNFTPLIFSVKRTWVRRVLLLAYVLPGLAYNILWYHPKVSLIQAYHFIKSGWPQR